MFRTFIVRLMLTVLAALCVGAFNNLSARPLSFSFADPKGDNTGRIDVVRMDFNFDNATGGYTIAITADSAHPFLGQFRVNINLFNPDTGTTNQNPSFFQDNVRDFNLTSPTTTITIMGTNPRLLSWKAGDRVSTNTDPFGNPQGSSLFRSSVLDIPLLSCFMCQEDGIAFGASGFTTIAEGEGCGTDISSKIQVGRLGIHYIYPSTYLFSERIILINRSSTQITGTINLILDGLPTDSEFLFGSQLITTCGSPNGSYRIPVTPPGNILKPSDVIEVPLVFATQRLGYPTFRTRVLSGAINR